MFDDYDDDDEVEKVEIDIERLREDLRSECMGAYFGGGFGGALVQSFDVDSASPAKLIAMAREMGIDIELYEI